MKLKVLFLLTVLVLFSANIASYAQDSTEVITVQDTTTVKKANFFTKFIKYFADANKPNNKKFNVSFIGGPHYATDIGFGIGVVASGLYSTNRKDSLTPISNIALQGDITHIGFVLVGLRGNNIFTRAKWRIDYSTYFYLFPSAFWGLGYDMGNDQANATKFDRIQFFARADFLYKIAKNLYIGPTIGFDWATGANFQGKDSLLVDKLLGDKPRTTRAFHYGATLSYDSRDFIPNPYKGIYLMLKQRNYTDFSSKPYFSTLVQFNFYQKVWRDCILAYDLYGQFNYGATPWTMMAPIGGSYRMRGYYEGRYRDDNMITTQVELRQRIWRRIGAVAWVGAGNVWGQGSDFSWSHTLPNYGVGLRWEFKKRVNVRLDYGFGKMPTTSDPAIKAKRSSAFIFGINEAF